jgi:hypothetical protein
MTRVINRARIQRYVKGVRQMDPVFVDNVEFADTMIDRNNPTVGLRFDMDRIFAMPADLAAHVGQSLIDCAALAKDNNYDD